MRIVTREEAVTFLSYMIESMSGLLSNSAIASLEQISENIQNERAGYDTWGADEEELHILYADTDDPEMQAKKAALQKKYALRAAAATGTLP